MDDSITFSSTILIMDFKKYNIVAIIPAYRVEQDIKSVLGRFPAYIKHIIVVDDASPDSSADLITAAAKKDKRIILIRHSKNKGVGGAMVSGFRKTLELGAQIAIKLDGDAQMDPAYIPALLTPLILGKTDYAKGNRFRDFGSLRKMPLIRRIGNLGLSFFTKAATGYWNIFDPTNGFFAIRTEVLAQLPLEQIDNRYFFETSMLANLYLFNAFVMDVPIPARYGSESSSLSIQRAFFEFPFKLARTFLRRILLKYFLFDFSMMSIYLLTSVPLLLFGFVFGIFKWIHYAELGIPAPTGTVILPTLSVILGIQIILSAIDIDMNSMPRQPLTNSLE